MKKLAQMGVKPFVAVFLAGGLFAIAADAPEDFRVVDGRLYNVQKSTNWLRLSGWPVAPTNGGVMFQNPRRPERQPREKETVITREGGQLVVRERLSSSEAWLLMNPPKLTPIERGEKNSWELPALILVRNLSTNTLGQMTTFLAMRVGSTNGLELWDVGVAANHSGTPKAEAPANREKPSP